MSNELPPGSEPNVIHLKKRSPEAVKAYWEGYKAGLTAALHGVQRSIDHFDDLLISGAMGESGGKN
jgi:hypothetical protein